MISISKRKTNIDEEKRIITNLITNDDYSKNVIPLLEHDTFEINYFGKIAKWCSDYFIQYQESPKKMIKQIFDIEKRKLQLEDSELISDLLEIVSREHQEQQEINTDYLVQSSLNYIKQRHYTVLGEKIQNFAKIGEVTECEGLLAKNKSFSVDKSGYINLHDIETAKKIILNKEKNILFTMDSALGELIGPVSRGQLFGIMGKSGIGKSFLLREILIQAMMNKLRCVEFNWEMLDTSVAMRHYKRIFGLGEQAGNYLFPIFDCKLNQNGSCKLKERRSKVPLMNKNGEIPEYGGHNPEYVPCDVCRKIDKRYKLATWHESLFKHAIDIGAVKDGIEDYRMIFGDNLRTVVFPKFSATVKDCEFKLDMMEYNENYIADFAIFDYDDIIKPEGHYDEPRHGSDEIYKRICGMLQQRKMAGFIGVQLNRTGAKKKKSEVFDVSSDYKKIMHLDGIIILNQTEKEKDAGIITASLGKMREGKFTFSKSVKILQQLEVGQSCLDSEWNIDIEE